MARSENTVQQSWVVASCIALVVIAVDQLTKTWAQSSLHDEKIHLFGSLYLGLTYNKGIAFGLGEGVAPALVLIAIIGMILVMFGKRIHFSGVSIVGVGLVLGGAFGNASDRVFRDSEGAVVDFIDLGWWPVFNLADASIVIGSIILVLWGSRKPVEQ